MKREQSIRRILIKNATIIDGTGKEPFISSLLVKNNKIKQIGNQLAENETDKVIDATGMFILPGMIDCHVHVMINQYDLMSHIKTPFSFNFYKSVSNMESLLHGKSG